MGNTSWDPLDNWSVIEGRWMGEAGYYGDDVPGTKSNPADFSSVQRRYSGSWSSVSYTGNEVDACYYHLTYPVDSTSSFNIYTDPLTHVC